MAQTGQSAETQDPREKGPAPPFPEQQQNFPGLESEVQPQPDHGEDSYEGKDRLAGKKALITGGDSGIGRAVVLAFAREGADVAFSYLEEEEDAKVTADLVRDAGQDVFKMRGDIQEEGHCRRLVERSHEELGGLDVLVNNAAFHIARESIEEIPSEEFDRTFKTNIYAMFYITKAALPRMEPGSSIINTSSIEAYEPNPSLLPYAATKGAIVTFTKGLAKMAAEQGVRANVVAPGPVWTPLISAANFPDEKVEQFGKTSVFDRPAQPVELAPAYVFLASDEASYVTGEVYGVTGGRMPG